MRREADVGVKIKTRSFECGASHYWEGGMRLEPRHNNAGCIAVTVAFILQVYGNVDIHYGYTYSTQCHFIKREFTQGRFARRKSNAFQHRSLSRCVGEG